MSNQLRQHTFAILIALLIGLVYIAPHVFFAYTLGDDYKGIYISRSYDEEAYYAIVRQAYDGVPTTDNPYIAEYKGQSIGSLYKFPEHVIGTVGSRLGISLSSAAIFSKFLFPAVLALVVYFFVLRLTRDRVSGIVAMVFLLLGFELAPLNIGSVFKTLTFNSPFESFLFFNRPINPQVSAVFFFMFLSALLGVWQDPNSKSRAIVAGILLGFLAYLYFYFWNFAVIFSGLILIYSLIVRNRELIKGMLWTLGTSLVVAIPFILDMLQALSGQESAIGKNYVLTHRFIFEKVIILPLIFFIAMWSWNYISKRCKGKKIDLSFLTEPKYIFLFLLIAAGFVASNQQVIHGHEIQQHHYHFMLNIPVFIIFLSTVIPALCRRYLGKYALIIPVFIAILAGIHGMSVQTSSYKFWKPAYTQYQSYAEFFDWLTTNTKVNSTVYSDDILSELIPMYTHNTVYSALHASVYPVPLPRLEHNFFVYMYFEGVGSREAREYMYREDIRNKMGQYIFEGQYWRAVCGSFGCFPDKILDELYVKYQEFLKKPFVENLKKYKVEYILWDKAREPEWKIDTLPFVKKVFERGDTGLYEVV